MRLNTRCIKRILLSLILAISLCSIGDTDKVLAAGTDIPILMYHNITADGNTDSMTVTQERFRKDMKYLQQQGYTSLLPADLVNIRSGAKQMPQKPVMITFDDGYESNYNLAFPILRESGVKATISLITSDIRDESGQGLASFMTWEQAREMYRSGIISFGSHSHNLHNPQNGGLLIRNGVNGVQRLYGETWSRYQQRVSEDIATSVSMIENKIPGSRVLYFSYPFGETDDWLGQVLVENRIYISTTTSGRVASIRNGLYGLSRFRVTMERSAIAILG